MRNDVGSRLAVVALANVSSSSSNKMGLIIVVRTYHRNQSAASTCWTPSSLVKHIARMTIRTKNTYLNQFFLLHMPLWRVCVNSVLVLVIFSLSTMQSINGTHRGLCALQVLKTFWLCFHKIYCLSPQTNPSLMWSYRLNSISMDFHCFLFALKRKTKQFIAKVIIIVIFVV